jgi:hypothetical protein
MSIFMPSGAEAAKRILAVVNYQPEALPMEVLRTLRQLARESRKESNRMKRERKREEFIAKQREVLKKALIQITDEKDRAKAHREFTKLINTLLPDLLVTFNPYQNRIIFRSRELSIMDAQHGRFTASPLLASTLKDPIRTAESLALTPGTVSDIGEAIWALASLYTRGLAIRFRRCLVCKSIFYADDLRRRVCPPPKRCQQLRAQNNRRTPEYRKKRREYMKNYRY